MQGKEYKSSAASIKYSLQTVPALWAKYRLMDSSWCAVKCLTTNPTALHTSWLVDMSSVYL